GSRPHAITRGPDPEVATLAPRSSAGATVVALITSTSSPASYSSMAGHAALAPASRTDHGSPSTHGSRPSGQLVSQSGETMSMASLLPGGCRRFGSSLPAGPVPVSSAQVRIGGGASCTRAAGAQCIPAGPPGRIRCLHGECDRWATGPAVGFPAVAPAG